MAASVVALRFFTRSQLVGHIACDDWLILAALLIALAYVGLEYARTFSTPFDYEMTNQRLQRLLADWDNISRVWTSAMSSSSSRYFTCLDVAQGFSN